MSFEGVAFWCLFCTGLNIVLLNETDAFTPNFFLTHRFSPGQGLVLYPQIGDKMDIVCPRADASSGGKEEFYRVYLVSRSQMESCTIAKTDTPLLNCDKPHQDVKFTFKFQEFSPNLWGLEFLKGRDYYITCESLCATSRLISTLKKQQNTATSRWFLQVELNQC